MVKDVFEDAYNYMKSGQLMRQVVNKISGIDFNNLAERQHFGDIYEQILTDLQSAGNAGEYYTPRAVTAFMADRIDPKPGEILLDPACGTGGFLTCSLRHMRERYVKRTEDEQKMQAALRAVEKKQLPHMLCVTNMLLHGIEDPSFVRHDNTLARPYISYTQSDRVDIILTNPPFGGREEDGIESNFPKHFQTRETADLFLALIIRLLKPGGRVAVVLPDGSLFGEGVKTRLKEHLMEECNLHTIVRLPNSVFKPYASIGTNLLFFEKGEPTKDIWFYEHQVPEGQKAYSMTKPIRFEHLQGCIDWWGGPKRKGRAETPLAWKVTAEEVKARGYNLDIKNPHTVADDHGDPEELLASLNAAEAETANLRDQLKAILAEDDTALFFVVEPAEKGVVVPVVDAAALAFGERLVGFQGIIDGDEIGTAASQNPAYRSREPKSLLRGYELLNRLLVGRETGREQSLIPTGHHGGATITRELIGQLLPIAHTYDLRCGVMSKQPGWERDRSATRLQVTGRDIDDEAPDLALPAFLQLRGHNFDVPVHQKPGLRIDFEKGAADEGTEILPKDCRVLSGSQNFHRNLSFPFAGCGQRAAA